MSAAPPRPAMTKARRARIFNAHGGICYLTGVKIGPDDEWDVEHVIPWALSHDDSDENLRPALVDPHAVKTKDDVKRIAKAKRQAGEKGQWARRQKNGPQLKGRGFDKNGPKRKIPSRPFGR